MRQTYTLRAAKGRRRPGSEAALRIFLKAMAEAGASEATCRGYAADLRVFLTWWSSLERGRSAVEQAGLEDLASFRRQLRHAQGQKSSTVNRRVQALRRFFGFAQASGWREDDPSIELEGVPAEAREVPEALTAAETTHLLRGAGRSPRGMGPRNYAVVQLMLRTGLRVGEVCALRIGEVTLRPRSGFLWAPQTPSSPRRQVPLDAPSRRGLWRYLEGRGEAAEEEPLFVSERGGPLSVRSLQHTVAAAAQRGGIERIAVSPQTLRHTFARRYLQEHDEDLAGLAQVLGYATEEAVAIYLEPELGS